jgi:uncharacterized protein YeaO (DUF488 family)
MVRRMNVLVKRAYEAPAYSDGARFLVDRVWPRGKKRGELDIQDWLKEIAPSTELRKWFNHDPERWDEFRRRYYKELDDNPAGWQPLLEAASKGPITLVYGAKDSEHNQAVALKEYLQMKE